MRLALVTPVFPADLDRPARGVGTGSVTLVRALTVLRPDIDVHVIHFRAPRELTRRYDDPPFTLHAVTGSRWSRASPPTSPAQAELAAVLTRIHPDVVHVKGTASFVDGRRWPSVLSVHGITEREALFGGLPHARARWLFHKLREPPARSRYAHVIAIVGYVARELEGQIQGRVHFVPNAIDDAFFEVGASRADTEPLVVQSGALCPIKNPLTTVRAVGLLHRQGVACRLRLIGARTHPDYARRIERLVVELGIGDRVEMPGLVARSEMPGELSRARVLALPSHVEVAPLAISEASAIGVPSVASPAGGNAELISHGWSGWLVQPEDPVALANALRPFLVQPDLAREFGARARILAERHRAASVARATLEVYEAVLAGVT